MQLFFFSFFVAQDEVANGSEWMIRCQWNMRKICIVAVLGMCLFRNEKKNVQNQRNVISGFLTFFSGSSDHLNESYSDQGEGESPVKGGRMTRLRARGGVRDRPPIIDDDDEEIFRAAPPTQSTRKRKAGRPPRPVVEKVVERVGMLRFLLRYRIHLGWYILIFFCYRKTNSGKTTRRSS